MGIEHKLDSSLSLVPISSPANANEMFQLCEVCFGQLSGYDIFTMSQFRLRAQTTEDLSRKWGQL